MSETTKTRTPRVKSAQEMAIDELKKLTAQREILLAKAKTIHGELLEITPRITAIVQDITGSLEGIGEDFDAN